MHVRGEGFKKYNACYEVIIIVVFQRYHCFTGFYLFVCFFFFYASLIIYTYASHVLEYYYDLFALRLYWLSYQNSYNELVSDRL